MPITRLRKTDDIMISEAMETFLYKDLDILFLQTTFIANHNAPFLTCLFGYNKVFRVTSCGFKIQMNVPINNTQRATRNP